MIQHQKRVRFCTEEEPSSKLSSPSSPHSHPIHTTDRNRHQTITTDRNRHQTTAVIRAPHPTLSSVASQLAGTSLEHTGHIQQTPRHQGELSPTGPATAHTPTVSSPPIPSLSRYQSLPNCNSTDTGTGTKTSPAPLRSKSMMLSGQQQHQKIPQALSPPPPSVKKLQQQRQRELNQRNGQAHSGNKPGGGSVGNARLPSSQTFADKFLGSPPSSRKKSSIISSPPVISSPPLSRKLPSSPLSPKQPAHPDYLNLRFDMPGLQTADNSTSLQSPIVSPTREIQPMMVPCHQQQQQQQQQQQHHQQWLQQHPQEQRQHQQTLSPSKTISPQQHLQAFGNSTWQGSQHKEPDQVFRQHLSGAGFPHKRVEEKDMPSELSCHHHHHHHQQQNHYQQFHQFHQPCTSNGSVRKPLEMEQSPLPQQQQQHYHHLHNHHHHLQQQQQQQHILMTKGQSPSKAGSQRGRRPDKLPLCNDMDSDGWEMEGGEESLV